jgi:hypothetical protein
MVDVVEAPFDLPFQDPCRAPSTPERDEALFDGVRRGAFRAEPIGVSIRGGFRDRFQGEER